MNALYIYKKDTCLVILDELFLIDIFDECFQLLCIEQLGSGSFHCVLDQSPAGNAAGVAPEAIKACKVLPSEDLILVPLYYILAKVQRNISIVTGKYFSMSSHWDPSPTQAAFLLSQ